MFDNFCVFTGEARDALSVLLSPCREDTSRG